MLGWVSLRKKIRIARGHETSRPATKKYEFFGYIMVTDTVGLASAGAGLTIVPVVAYHGRRLRCQGPPTNCHFLPRYFDVWTLRTRSQTTSYVYTLHVTFGFSDRRPRIPIQYPSWSAKGFGEAIELNINSSIDGWSYLLDNGIWLFSERKLTFTFAIYMSSSVSLSVCRLSVCNVHAPYSGDWNCQQCFYAIYYVGHLLTSR